MTPPIEEQVRGLQILTAKGGPVECADSLRSKLAYVEDGRLFVATADARSAEVTSFVARLQARGKTPTVVPVPLSDIQRIYSANASAGIAGQGNNVQATRIRELLTAAASQRTTDIHWRLFEDTGVAQVLFRVNGLLQPEREWEYNYALELLRAAYQQRENETQLTPTMDQDARISDPALLPQGVSSVRVVSGPNSRGMDQVWRLTYVDVVVHGSLTELGYGERQTKQIQAVARSPYGMVVIGGPTGSGKSTTLQTVLAGIHRASHGKRHIYTIEEPVEMPIPGAMQHSTRANTENEQERNAAYVAATRRMLRSDPDVVMFGEIRDNETANVAVRTALAGRLVFTTLHGNTVLDLMLRVIHDLRVGKVLATDHGVFLMYISQSLVPTVCKHCSVPAPKAIADGHHSHSAEDIERILTGFTDPTAVRLVGPGCHHCRETGFSGRTLVAEVLRTTPEIMAAMRNDDKTTAMQLWLGKGGVTKRRVAHVKAARGQIDPLVAEFHVGELSARDADGAVRDIDIVLNYGYRGAA